MAGGRRSLRSLPALEGLIERGLITDVEAADVLAHSSRARRTVEAALVELHPDIRPPRGLGYYFVDLNDWEIEPDAVATGDKMDFDPELVIRLHWRGVAVRTLPTRVVYERGGLSHFRMFDDNARITWLYARALAGMGVRLPLLLSRRLRSALPGAQR